MQIQGHTLAEQDELSAHFQDRVVAALHRVADEAALHLVQDSFGVSPGLTAAATASDDVIVMWDDEVPELVGYLDGVYDAGALEAASELAANLPLPDGEGIPGIPDQFTLDYLHQASNRLKGVGDELWENIRDELATGVANGESVSQLATRIQNAAGFTEARAKTVARTELVGASNAGTHAQVQMIVPEAKKEWVATNDGRTRMTHHHADGQRVLVTDAFAVGSSHLRWPGDPGGAAGEVVNCRCTLIFDVDDDTPPAVTCGCAGAVLPVTAAFVAVPSGGCTCAVTQHDVPTNLPKKLTSAEHKAIFDAFMGDQSISPAYGGAKIHKKLAAARASLDKTHPHLSQLSDHELLAVIDEQYSGGSFTFIQKYDEWLSSSAGKKIGVHAVKSTPSVPKIEPSSTSNAPFNMDDLTQPYSKFDVFDAAANANVGDVVAEGFTAQGVPMRVVVHDQTAYGAVLRTQYWMDGKWNDNGGSIVTEVSLKKEHPNVQWFKPHAKQNVPKTLKVTAPAPEPTIITVHAPVSTSTITPSQKKLLLNLMKEKQPITPGWGGAKVYKQLEQIKAQIATSPDFSGLTDRELLQLMDEVAEHKTSKTYESVVTDWLNTPAGKKYAGGGPDILDKPKTGAVSTPATSHAPIIGEPHEVFAPMSLDELTTVAESGSEISSAEAIASGAGAPNDAVLAVATSKNGKLVRLVKKSDGVHYQMHNEGEWADITPVDSPEFLHVFEDASGLTPWKVPTSSVKTTAKKATKTTKATKTAKKAATPSGPPKVTNAAESILTDPGDISGYSSAYHDAAFKEFKTGMTGSFLNDSPQVIFDHLHEVVEILQKKSGFEGITVKQLIKLIDEKGAKNLGVPNKHLFEKKISDWLETPTGKKHANDVANGVVKVKKTPKSNATTSYSSPAYKTYDKPNTPELAAKVESAKPKSTRPFETIHEAEVRQMHDEMMAQQGDWTAAQKSSLRTYTGSSYHEINNCLRGKGPCSEQTLKHIKNAQAGMRRSTRNIILRRGTNSDEFPGFSRNATLEDLKSLEGRELTADSFLSTSFGSEAAFGGNVLIEFHVPAGTPMAYVKDISHFKSENEILLGAGARYVVESVTSRSSYQRIVKVRVIVP